MSKAFTDEESADASIVGREVRRVARGQERPMTVQGHRALTDELKRLLTVDRPALKQQGGFEVDSRLKELDHRVALLSATLENVRVVEPGPASGRVQFGSSVVLEWSGGRKQTLRLVGPDEVDVKRGDISIESPLARALVERQVGDEVEIERPRGVESATILSVDEAEPKP